MYILESINNMVYTLESINTMMYTLESKYHDVHLGKH